MRPANAAPSASTDQTSIASQPGMHSTYVAPPTHIVGFGARMGGAEFGFGGTARIWSRNQIGVQMDVSRATQNSSVAQERLTSLQFAPSAVYSFKDKMSESVWVRPYVGGGISFYRSSLSVTPDVGESVTDNGVGYQTFGGAELTFPSVPRFAISGDVGYQWAPTPFTGFDVGGMSFSFSGHWYVK
jgi:hypothetical protein